MIKCKYCGSEIAENINFCPKCGKQNVDRKVENPTCPKCHNRYLEGTIYCPEDGETLTDAIVLSYKDEKDVYREAFSKFDKEGFGATWSWVGFFFAAIWYLVKGMWAKVLIMVGVLIVSGGILAIPLWLYCGICGKWDYYLWKVKKKQLW